MMILDLEYPHPLEVLTQCIANNSEAFVVLRAAEKSQLALCRHPHPDVYVFTALLDRIKKANLNRNVTFLAIDYASRFLSSPKAYGLYDITFLRFQASLEAKKKWRMHSSVLTAAIASLASFMLGVDFDVIQFHRIAGLRFLLNDAPLEPQLYRVTEMELMVMEALEFRLCSVTPLAYLDLYLSLFPPALDVAKAIQDVKNLATEKIFSGERMIPSPSYEPFRKAFDALMEAANESYPQHADAFRGALHICFDVSL